MKFSKILMTALVVMMVFAVAPLASAGDGTQADPFEVLYIGWSYGPAFTSMGYVANGSASFNDGTTYFNHKYIDFDYTDANQTSPMGFYIIPEYVSEYVAGSSPDIVIVDMFFSNATLDPLTDTYYSNLTFVEALATLKKAHPDTKFVSVFSAEVDAHGVSVQSWAPCYFDYRDELQYTTQVSTFSVVFDGYISQVSPWTADWYDYERVMFGVARELPIPTLATCVCAPCTCKVCII